MRGIYYTNHSPMIYQGQNFQLEFLLHTLIETLILVDLILLGVWFFKQITKK